MPVTQEVRLNDAQVVTYPKRLGETGVVNTLYPYYDPRRYGAMGDNTTDDTTAMLNCLANNYYMLLPQLAFVVSLSSLIITTTPRPLIIAGLGPLSRLVNRCPPGTPAITILGSSYWELRDFAILGDIGFPNDGIFVQKDGSGNRPCFWRIHNLFLCPNGNGIHLQDVNTATIEHCQYWPSGYNGGATATNTLLKNAILADGTSTVNDVTIRKLNAVGYTTIANGGAAIRWNGPAGCGGITIDECEIEGTNPALYRSIDLKNVTAGATLRGNFVENSEVKIDSCTNVRLENPDGGGTAIYTVTASDQVTGDNLNAASFVADATNNIVSVRHSTFSTGLTFAAWVTATPYVVGSLVSQGGVNYVCIVAHTSGATTQPGIGASWQTDWALAGYANRAQQPYENGVRTAGSVLVPDRRFGINLTYAERTSSQTLGAAGRSTVICNANVSDPFSQYNGTTGVFTAKYAGKYRVTAGVTVAGSTSGKFFQLEVTKNSTTPSAYGSIGGTGTQLGGSWKQDVTLAVGDTITFVMYNSDTATQNVAAAMLEIEQIG